MAYSKVVYGGKTLIDLTADTVLAEHLIAGYTAHGADGEKITGTNDWDSNTQDATATDAEILSGKTAYVKGSKKTGTMVNNGGVELKITARDQQINIPAGYHDGSGTASIDAAEQAKLVADNIRQGVTILGIEGSMSGTEDATPQAKTVTPSASVQEVLPDEGYNYLSQVTVNAIPYVESENTAGGITVTIG